MPAFGRIDFEIEVRYSVPDSRALLHTTTRATAMKKRTEVSILLGLCLLSLFLGLLTGGARHVGVALFFYLLSLFFFLAIFRPHSL